MSKTLLSHNYKLYGWVLSGGTNEIVAIKEFLNSNNIEFTLTSTNGNVLINYYTKNKIEDFHDRFILLVHLIKDDIGEYFINDVEHGNFVLKHYIFKLGEVTEKEPIIFSTE